MAQWAAPDCGNAVPQYQNIGTHVINNHQPSSISTVYAEANSVLLGGDFQSGFSYNGMVNHHGLWKIIRKMSDDNRALIEQIARLTAQLSHLQSILYHQQSTNSLLAAQDMVNNQLNPVTAMSVNEYNSSKRVLSPMSEEQGESIEMDNDFNTRIVTFTQKKRRALGVSPSTKIQDKGISMSNQPKQSKDKQQESMACANVHLQNNLSMNNHMNEQQELHISKEAKR
ncbi:unnamed protein product [Rotaria sordida]|nr:unnamed protein product [Rotaria sordida]CAF4125311.1 unnamed protein product [Rotaria sordida]